MIKIIIDDFYPGQQNLTSINVSRPQNRYNFWNLILIGNQNVWFIKVAWKTGWFMKTFLGGADKQYIKIKCSQVTFFY